MRISKPPQSKHRPIRFAATEQGESLFAEGERLTWRVALGFGVGACACVLGILMMAMVPGFIFEMATDGSLWDPPRYSDAVRNPAADPSWIQAIVKTALLLVMCAFPVTIGFCVIQSVIRYAWSDTEVTITEAGILQVRRFGVFPAKATVPLERIQQTICGSNVWGTSSSGVSLIAPYANYRGMDSLFRSKKRTTKFRQSKVARMLPSLQITILSGRSREELDWVERWIHSRIDETLCNLKKIKALRIEQGVSEIMHDSVLAPNR